MIWQLSGGSGERTVLLLHGLGATAAVWTGLCTLLEARGGVRWIAADLGGHGGSERAPLYSVGQLAMELAPLVRSAPATLVVGHSLGAYVGLALASGWFGVHVSGVLGVGPKITWTQAELAGARELAARPPRTYANQAEAISRYRRVSGLTEQIAPAPAALARGVVQIPEGWQLAQDPATFAVAGASFATLAAAAAAPVVLARGEHDPMVSTAELAAHALRAQQIAGAGHNVHVENPRALLGVLEPLLGRG